MLDTLGTRSIWTIDLLILLHTITQDELPNCSYLLCSKTLGVNREHTSLRYYEKAFGKDQIRVNGLFVKANEIGLNLLCVSHLGLAQVIRLVAQPNILAILLLDNTILRARTTSWQTSSTTYAGHYVIVCGMSCDPFHVRKAKQNDGISTDDYCMVVKNPGSGNETDYVTPSLLEMAWRAKGTDDDVIFVMKHQEHLGDN